MSWWSFDPSGPCHGRAPLHGRGRRPRLLAARPDPRDVATLALRACRRRRGAACMDTRARSAVVGSDGHGHGPQDPHRRRASAPEPRSIRLERITDVHVSASVLERIVRRGDVILELFEDDPVELVEMRRPQASAGSSLARSTSVTSRSAPCTTVMLPSALTRSTRSTSQVGSRTPSTTSGARGFSGFQGRYPSVVTRYRCRACGNITRFEVVETSTTRSYHHFTVGGDLAIEDPVIVDAHVESVTCRWCGHGRRTSRRSRTTERSRPNRDDAPSDSARLRQHSRPLRRFPRGRVKGGSRAAPSTAGDRTERRSRCRSRR